MRLVIVGQKLLASSLFDLCRALGHDVACVCSPAGDRLAARAAVVGVPVVQDLSAADVPYGTDLILAAHCHVFIGADVRARARTGALGYHPSLLPLHRGRDAIRWAMHMRERVTGGSVYWLDDGIDTGDVAAQGLAFIRPDDTPMMLWQRELMPLGLRLFRKVLIDVAAGRVVRRPQDEQLATWEPSFDRAPLARTKGNDG